MTKLGLRVLLAAATTALVATAGSSTAAPVPYAGGTYSQNFDGLPTTANSTTPFSQTLNSNPSPNERGPYELTAVTGATGIDGWYGANNGGTGVSMEFRAHNGSQSGGTGRGVLSLGADGSTERALGGLPTSAQIPRWGVIFTNNSTNTYTSVDVSFVTEQWRRGDVAAPGDVAAFAYALNVTSINDAAFTAFTALDAATVNSQAAPTNVALDGNDPANRASVASTISGLSWAPGQTLALRWSLSDITGQDNGLGIDNFSFTAAVPEPASTTVMVLGVTALARRARRTSR